MAKKQEIQHKYDSSADIYDSRYSEIQKEKYELALQDLELQKPILDLGCGTGLLKDFLGVELIGCDISRNMLKKAKNKGMLVVQADIEHLPFKNKFKTILSFTALQNVPDVTLALSEIKRLNAKQIVLTYLDKFDFIKQIQKEFDVQEIRKIGEDVCLICCNLV